MKSTLLKLTVILLLLSCGYTDFATTTVPDNYHDILIVHSYNDCYEWTIDIDDGIKDTISNRQDLRVRVEYMDTKNIMSEQYFDELYAFYKYKYANTNFDAIISSDDNAFNFLVKYRNALFGNTPIFFCGVNSINDFPFDTMEHIYGVTEHLSTLETIEVARTQNPDLKNIYLITDSTVTGRAVKKSIYASLIDQYNIVFVEGNNIYEIAKYLKTIPQSEDSIVLFTFYVVDDDGTVHTIRQSTEIVLDSSKIPVYGLWSFSFGNGTVGGKLITGYSQGQRAAQLMLDYLDGARYSNNRFLDTTDVNEHKYDYEVMTKYNLDVSLLPKNSSIINKPASFFEKHKRVLIASLAIIIFLIIYIIVLKFEISLQTKKIHIVQEKIVESEKMASLGMLVSGVAHEINTPLGNSLTTASYISKINSQFEEKINHGALRKSDLADFMHELDSSSNLLLKNLQNASQLVIAFKSIATTEHLDKNTEFDFKSYLDDFATTMNPLLLQKNHTLKVTCPDNTIIYGQPAIYYHILNQLLTNSIEHGFENMKNGLIQIDAAIKHDILHIHFKDNGIGIREKSEKKIFEPFYTNKRGTGHIGLGLYSVYNTVHSLNGDIQCHNLQNAGVSFDIEIPVNK